MSLFSRLTEALAGESGELKKIRMDSERRRAGKSTATAPKVKVEEPSAVKPPEKK
jgi:hypothetical protein